MEPNRSFSECVLSHFRWRNPLGLSPFKYFILWEVFPRFPVRHSYYILYLLKTHLFNLSMLGINFTMTEWVFLLLIALFIIGTKHSAWNLVCMQWLAAKWMNESKQASKQARRDNIIVSNMVCLLCLIHWNKYLMYIILPNLHNISFIISLYYRWGYRGTEVEAILNSGLPISKAHAPSATFHKRLITIRVQIHYNPWLKQRVLHIILFRIMFVWKWMVVSESSHVSSWSVEVTELFSCSLVRRTQCVK